MQARQLHLDFVPVYVFLSGSRKILSRIHFVNNGFKSQGHAFAWLFYYQVPQESSSTRFVVKSSLTGLTLSNTQHPLTTRGESMYRMEKITTGAAYGASAGSILNGMLNAYSPEQWNAIGVLVGIVIAVLTYLTNLYFKIREDNRRSRSRDEPDTQE